ncbi:hypothetical protein HMPREF2760_00320 [Corynebacterium sp. HMSC065D07]|uniref:PrsW family intramembrane metalloprotease n=1 Tax=unclassified Corynebacterium TaxID=2624378 RepID=UPI0008A4FC02|nr:MULTISPECIES: PrsW family intramembrane metalloprotease [unclassified Corynebacterium]OFL58557.1 hypothetical protein HMPREF2760_00320 [Corynebacterium sp. HMSC065D07]OFP69800.1 hypothetical protein HMPREF2974_04695 [Corynebacterium sp. HMSC078C09]
MSKIFRVALWVIIGICLPAALINLLGAFLVAPLPGLISLLIGFAFLALGLYLWHLSPMWARPAKGWATASVLWGAGTAVSLALLSALPFSSLTKGVGWEESMMSWSGAYPEEFAKALGVVFVLLSFRQLNRPWHGFIVGALVGWGFEVFENVLYASLGAVMHPTSDWIGMLQMWGLRLVAGPGLHMSLTVIAGFGIGWAIYAAHKTWWWRLGVGVGALFVSFCLHFAWNYMWDETWQLVTQYIVVALILYPIVITLGLRAHRLAKADDTYSHSPGSASLR